jgi:phosphatidylinositol alpha-1,6-mannosyltransferase
VDDGETGFVVRHAEDADAVAVAVARLLDDDGLRRRLGAAGRARAEAEFTYDALAGRLQVALDLLA